ncbi:MAG TPA: OadG family protein [Atopostipes sp.]|nr:OadG family protein [Atopostipes sp.]
MTSISLFDGLMLTIVSMLVVFLVLAAIWGLTELTAHFAREEAPSQISTPRQPTTDPLASFHPPNQDDLPAHEKHQKAAEIIALILASEDQSNKKFEIIESKRVK